MDSERLTLTTVEAAVALGISVSLAQQLIRTGRIRAVKAGRRTLIPATELQRFLSGEDANG